MLERTVVLVDTSYLLASFYNSWETGARAQLSIDLPEVVHILGEMIQKQLRQPIHRQYWYDGIPDSGPHRYQRALRTCDGVILRTGQLIEWGDRRTQKAVDTRLVADMVLTAVHQTVSDIVLVSGDADMIPGVEEATNAGIRVHLYGFGWDSMSSALRHVCDSTTVLDPREDFTETMQLQVLEGPVPPAPHIKPVGDGGCPEETGATPLPHLEDETVSPDSIPDAFSAPSEPVSDPGTLAPHTAYKAAEDTHVNETSVPQPNVAQDAAQAAAQVAHTPAGTNSAENFSVDQAELAANRFTESHTAANLTSGFGQEREDCASLRPDTRAPQSPDTLQQPRQYRITPASLVHGDSTASPEYRHSATEDADSESAVSATTAAEESTTSAAQDTAPSHTEDAPAAQAPHEQDTAPSHTEDTTASVGQDTALSHATGAEVSAAVSPESTPKEHTGAEDVHPRDTGAEGTVSEEDGEAHTEPRKQPERPKPSMMAPRRKLRSRYVPLPNEVWTSQGAQTPFDVGQQYATWWFDHAATQEQRDQAHMLSGGGLPPEVDRPLLQFACETLHEYTLSQSQRVDLRDGFHSGIRGVLMGFPRDE